MKCWGDNLGQKESYDWFNCLKMVWHRLMMILVQDSRKPVYSNKISLLLEIPFWKIVHYICKIVRLSCQITLSDELYIRGISSKFVWLLRSGLSEEKQPGTCSAPAIFTRPLPMWRFPISEDANHLKVPKIRNWWRWLAAFTKTTSMELSVRGKTAGSSETFRKGAMLTVMVVNNIQVRCNFILLEYFGNNV